MGKQHKNPTELSKEEFDNKLGSSIDKLVDNGTSEEDIKFFIDDFKTMYTVKKKDISQSENTTSVSETPISDTQEPKKELQSVSKIEKTTDVNPLIKNEQFNPALEESLFNREYVENPNYKFNKGYTFEKNKDFDPSRPVSIFNQEFIEKPIQKIESKLDRATPEQLDLLNKFESLNDLSEEEIKSINKSIDTQKKGDFGFFRNIKNAVVSTPLIGTTMNPLFNPANISKVDKKEDLIKSKVKEKQIDFIKDLSDEDKKLLNSFVKSKRFKEDAKLKLITDDINKIDEKLLPATNEIEEIDLKLNEYQKEKQKLIELAKNTDNIDYLKTKYEEINNAQADLLEVRTNKYNEANSLFEERVKKVNEVEDHTSSVGTIEQEIDLLKRNYGFIENVTTRAGLGFAELGQNAKYLIDKNNLRIERNDLKAKLRYGWHKSDNPELRNQVPPQYLVGDYVFNEEEFDLETKKLKDSMLTSTSITKNILEGWRDTIRPNISVSEINSFSDVIDFTVDGIADNTATVTQLAIPYVGEALFLVNQKQGTELGLRIDDLKVRESLDAINKKLENKFTLPIDEIDKLEKEKKSLESKVMSDLKIQASSSLMAVSELAFSKLFGEAKRLKTGKRILSDATNQELKREVKRSIKDWAKYSAKGVKEVIKDGAEEGFLDEFLTNVTQNTIKKYYIGDDKVVSIFDNSIDAIAGGLSVGSVMSASPRMAGQFVSHISSNKKRNKVYNNIKKISELEKFIDDNSDLDKTLLNETKLKIIKLKYDNHKTVNSTIEGFDNLNTDEKKELLRLSTEAVSLDIAIDKLNEKKSLSQIEYAMKNELEEKLQNIDIRKEEISSKEIVAKVNGKEIKFTNKTFEDFIKVDENVKDIKNGKIDISFKNQENSSALLENRIKEVFSTATKKTKDFASSISENTNDISSEVAEGVVSVKDNGTEMLLKEGSNGDIIIESIRTDETSKGKGNARKVMEKAINIADEKNSRLVLDVVPENESVSKEKLTSFYESLGFVKDGETKMVREPKKDNSFDAIDNVIKQSNNTKINKKPNEKPTTKVETTKDTYDVSVENGEIKITPKLSKSVSETEARKVKKQYIKEADFTGKETDFTGMESASDSEINDFIADNSESPIEVANALSSVRKSKLDKTDDGNIDKETAIAIAVYDGVDKKDFIRHSGHPDANNSYFKKNKDGKVRGIERIVEELQSEYPHFEFDVSDVTDLIASTSREDLNNMIKNSKSDIEIKLEQKFKELTGLKASESIINDVIDTSNSNDNTSENFNKPETYDDVPFQTNSKELLNLEGSALNSLVNRLLKTGLAKSVKILSDKGISDFLKSIGIKTVKLQQNTELDAIKEKAISDGTFMKAPNGERTKLNEKQWLQVRTQNFKDWFGDWINDPENSSKVIDDNGEPLIVYHGSADNINVFDDRYGGETTANNDHGAFYFSDEFEVAEDYGRQAIIRKLEGSDRSTLIETWGLSEEQADFIEEYGLEDFADKELNIVHSFLNIREPLIDKTQEYSLLDTQKTQRQVNFVKNKIDEEYEFTDYYVEIDSDLIDDYKDEIEERARDNYSLDETDEVEDYMIEEATTEILEENGIYPELKDLDGVVITNVQDDIGFASQMYQNEYIVINPNQIKSATENNGSFSDYNDDIRFQKELSEKGITLTPNGFVYDGTVYLNRDKVKRDTPIHEFGHLWNEYAKKNMPDVYNKGLELIKNSSYHKDVLKNPAYEHLSEEQKLEEALAQAIGEKGSKIVEESKKEKFANWFKNLFTKIAKGLGLTDAKKNIDAKINEINKYKEAKINELKELLDNGKINQDTYEKRVKVLNNNAVKKIYSLNNARSKKISELKLDEFTNLVSGELLSGEQIVKNETNDNNFNKKADVSTIDVIVSEQKAIKETREKMYKMFRDKNFYIKNIKKELQKYIRKNIDSKRLNELKKSELNKLIDVVASTNSKKRLLKVLNEVDEIILKTDNRIILGKINKILNSKLFKKEAGRIKANRIDEQSVFILSNVKKNISIKKKGKEDTFTNDQRVANKISELIDDKLAIINKEWIETENGLEHNELSEEELLSIEALNISIQILEAKSNATSQKSKNEILLEALEDINSIYTTGRSNLIKLKEETKKREDKVINDIKEDIDPDNKKSELSLTQLQKKNKQGTRNFFERIIFNLYQGKGAGSLDSMASLLSRKGGENRDDSAFVKFVNSLKRDETRKKTRIKIFADYLDNLRNERFGSLKKANRVFSKKIDLELSKPIKDTDNRVPVIAPFTQSELLNVWMNFKNKTLREGLAQNGFTEEVVSKIDKILPDNLKKYGEDLYLVYEDLYRDANDVYKRMNYHSLGKPEFYAGKVYRSDTTVKEDTDALLGGKANIRTTGYDSQKARTVNSKPIEAVDVNFLVNKAIQESSHYVAFAENHRLYTKILKDNSIKKAIELNNKGKSDLILSALNFYKVRDLEQGGDRGIPIVDFFARNIVKSTLALKTKIGITQTISFINGSMDMPIGLSPVEFASYYNPKDIVLTFKELMSKSDYLRNRYDVGGIDNAMLGLQDLANQSKVFQNDGLEAKRKEVARFYKGLLDYSMINVKFGDAIGVMGAIPMYNAWLDKYSKKYSKEVAEKKAMAKFESAVDRSQQSTSAFGKSQWQRHPVMKYFMMFATSPIQNHQNAMYHLRELRRGLMKGQDNAKGTNLRNGLAFVNYQFVQPVLYTYIAGALAGSLSTALGFGDDEPDDADKDILRAFIMGNSNAIPYIGLISQTILEHALGKQNVFGGVIKSPVFDNMNKVTTYWQKAYKSKNKDTSAKYTRKALSETAGILAGVPKFAIDTFYDMNNIYWNEQVDVEVKFLKSIGYSDYTIKQSRTKRMTKREASRKKAISKRKYEKSKIKRHKTPKVYKKNQRK